MTQNPFVVHVNEHKYRIEPICDVDCIWYEVFTDSGKLFTVEMGADGKWKTLEANVFAIDKALISEIGKSIIKYYTF